MQFELNKAFDNIMRQKNPCIKIKWCLCFCTTEPIWVCFTVMLFIDLEKVKGVLSLPLKLKLKVKGQPFAQIPLEDFSNIKKCQL